PALADLTIQRERLVLRENKDAPQAGVDAIGKRDVDDTVDAAEGYGGFGAVAGERIEAFPGAPASKIPSVSFIGTLSSAHPRDAARDADAASGQRENTSTGRLVSPWLGTPANETRAGRTGRL